MTAKKKIKSPQNVVLFLVFVTTVGREREKILLKDSREKVDLFYFF